MSNEETKFTTLDTLFLIGGCISLWGDDNLSEEEVRIFNSKLSEIDFNKEFEITNPGFRDRRDSDLCKKEYLLWIFDTISSLKLNISKNSDFKLDSQEQVLITLTKHFSSSIGWGKWATLREIIIFLVFFPLFFSRALQQPIQRKNAVLFLDSLIKADGSVDSKEVEYLMLFRKKTKWLFWKL